MEPGAVRILFLLQDPSSSPQWPKAVGCEDGHVCPWCHTDSSGRNIERLFTEHLSRVLKMDRQGRWPVVFSNGVLHGPLVKREPEDEELEHCALVNRRLVEILRPTLVVAMGVQARDHVMPPIFGDAARTNAFLEGARPVALEGKRHIFWTGHPSGNGFPERAEEMARSFKAIRRHLMAHP
jgi:uracil-DNA glycosylase